MIKYLLFLLTLLIIALGLLYQHPQLSHQLGSYPTNRLGHQFKQFVTLDSLQPTDQKLLHNHEDDDLNPTSLGWVRRLIREFPEISWYANDDVRRTFEGSYQLPEFCWSKAIYGKYYPEFDRAILSVWCLRAFYNGSKEAWNYMIGPQMPSEALSWNSFQDIHHELVRFIENHPWLTRDQALLTMETYLLLADSGKTPYAQVKAREWRVFSLDTRDFFQKSLESCPQIYPSLKRLPHPCVDLICSAAYPIHMGHLRHLEGHPRTLRRLIDSHLLQQAPINFEFYYLIDLCDAAAFFGQLDVKGSLFLNESMYRVNVSVKQACECTLTLDEYEAYSNYLYHRSSNLGLNADSKQDRVLTRIGAMLRLNDEQHGAMLKRSFSKLNVYLQAMILSQLDIRDRDPLKRTPNYIPAVLTNLLQNEQLGLTFQERLDKTFVLGLPFIANVLLEHRKALNMRRSDPSLPLNFNHVSKRVGENPYILNHVRFQINDNNVIQIE